jgi:hypothetical protein
MTGCHAQPVHSQCYCALSCTACVQSVLLCTIMHNLYTVLLCIYLLTREHQQLVQVTEQVLT